MFSWTYFKQIVKSNFKLWGTITGILCLLIGIVMKVFNPETINEIALRQDSMNGFNPLGKMDSLLSFISNQYYGLFALLLPMIFIIVTGNNLIAKKIDNGSPANELATPISRTKILITSAIYLILSLVTMFICISIAGVTTAELTQPGQLDVRVFLMLTFGCFLLQLAISGISFLGSCLFNSSGKSLAVGVGIPLTFYVLKIVSEMNNSLEKLRFFSINPLFDTEAIINGQAVMAKLASLLIISVICYIVSYFVFTEKDLPL